VNRAQKAAVLIAAIAIPAAAYSMLAPVKDSLCLASGATTYRLAHGAASPDFRIKISGDAVQPDLRVQWVDRAEIADFVLVDDGDRNGPTTCRSTAPIRTVAFDTDVLKPDVTVKLSAEPAADYKIYVQSARFSQQDAAALVAAIWKDNQQPDVTGSIR
jgi:hypothetical protein